MQSHASQRLSGRQPQPGQTRHSTAEPHTRCPAPGPSLPPLVHHRAPGHDERSTAFARHPHPRQRDPARGSCLQPVLLRGRVDHIDGTTGELLHRYTTVHEPGGILPIACKTGRASQCPPCAEVYRADTYQLGAFLTAAQGHRLFAFYRLAAFTGARRGELLYLRWEAVNLDMAEVTFGSTAVVRGQRLEGTTKGGRSRTISLDRDTVTVLREHRRQQAEERLAAGSTWTDTGGLVFVSRWGEPLHPDTVTALMTKLTNRHNRSVTPPIQAAPPRKAA